MASKFFLAFRREAELLHAAEPFASGQSDPMMARQSLVSLFTSIKYSQAFISLRAERPPLDYDAFFPFITR
jgi:hypothetical protein